MQKLSRTEKYRDYRNKLNNSSEREIATKELRELQERIILNEKRFGDSSRTESDLNRGRKDTLFDNVNTRLNYSTKQQNADYLNDIYNELNKYNSRNISNQKNETKDNRDDYLNKISDILNRSEINKYRPAQKEGIDIQDKINEFEKIVIKEPNLTRGEQYNKEGSSLTELPEFDKEQDFGDFNQIVNETTDEGRPIEDNLGETSNSFGKILDIDDSHETEEDFLIEPQETTEINTQANEFSKDINTEIENSQPSFEDELNSILNIQPNEDHIKSDEQEKTDTAEFVDEKPVDEFPKSQLDDVQVKRADIKPTIPQHDHSKEFEEICMNVNSLAEEIDSANSFAKDQYVPPVVTHKPDNSFEGIQQNVKKDLIGAENDNSDFDDLSKEVDQNNNENDKPKDKQKIVTKREFSNEMKEEFDNTVSLQVDKLLGEINSSKADTISATEIMKGNDIAKKDINDHPGKTIAFEIDNKEEMPDNTIVLSNPTVEDTSIKTMSFKTEDLVVEDTNKGSTILNIILSILIVIAVGALGVIIYFFLITRGII